MLQLPPPARGWRRVLLVRHGETEANEKGLMQGLRIDSELNAKGLDQAVQLGSFLSQFKIGVITTSALRRAKQTAFHIIQPHDSNLDKLELAELNEMDYGAAWDGTSLSQVFEQIKELSQRWRQGATDAACPDGGESPDNVLLRASAGLRKVVDAMTHQAQDSVAVIVAHNFVNKILLSNAENGHLRDLHRYEQSHTCINVLDVNVESYAVDVRLINYFEHARSKL